ncbi:hypothetical protein M422DRAFT_33647, partial [Sphaerobolus stellatus SS14]
MLMFRCPSLQKLFLEWTAEEDIWIPQLLLQAQRSELRNLSLGGHVTLYKNSTYEERGAIMNSFLSRHPTVEHLEFNNARMLYPGCMATVSLPYFRSLSLHNPGSRYDLVDLIPIKVAQRLECLQTLVYQECLPIIQEMSTLRSFSGAIPEDLLEEFIDSIPNIEKLYPSMDSSYGHIDKTDRLMRFSKAVKTLTLFGPSWACFSLP